MIGPLSCRHDVRQAGADAFELVLTTMQRETFLLPRQAHPKEAYPTAEGRPKVAMPQLKSSEITGAHIYSFGRACDRDMQV